MSVPFLNIVAVSCADNEPGYAAIGQDGEANNQGRENKSAIRNHVAFLLATRAGLWFPARRHFTG